MTLFLAIATGMILATIALMMRGVRRGAPRLAAGVTLLVPALVALLYLLVGTPAGLDPQAVAAPESLEDAVARLENDLQRDPRQPEGWMLLGRSYAAMERPDDARDAIERAARLLPDDDGLQVEYAQARAQAHPRRLFDAVAVQSLRDVLARSPEHQHARWFLGIAQRQAGDDAAAAATWEPLLEQLDDDTAGTLRDQINLARVAAGLPPLAQAQAQAQDSVDAPHAASHALRVRVRLGGDAAALAQLSPDTPVFVLARQPGGSPMPVAAQRYRLADLPLELTLDDTDSPMPTQRLSALDAVEVVARISVGGTANRSDGDIESAPVRVALPTADVVELVIDPTSP